MFRVAPPSAFFAVATRSAEAERRGGGGQLQRGRMSRCDVPRLLSWASDNGVRLHPSVEVRATADRGLGVFATGPLAAGVPILSVPSGLLLSPLSAARSQTPPSLAAVREQIARLSATLTLRLTDELALIALLLRREGAPLLGPWNLSALHPLAAWRSQAGQAGGGGRNPRTNAAALCYTPRGGRRAEPA